jgi:hypothetical protein
VDVTVAVAGMIFLGHGHGHVHEDDHVYDHPLAFRPGASILVGRRLFPPPSARSLCLARDLVLWLSGLRAVQVDRVDPVGQRVFVHIRRKNVVETAWFAEGRGGYATMGGDENMAAMQDALV